VYPVTANDVGAAVLFSQANSLDLAVCGGGHSTGGASSTEGGLCIDLSKMRDVVVDPVKRTITAQGGALWADVDRAAGEHGLATVGGTVNHTGIGGLTLGGGYGWLSNAYGLVIDNLLEVEIVLADGGIVKASETENRDLFWAVRGAGSCFGVVTTFVYRAHNQKNPVWAGTMAFPPPALASIVDFGNRQVEITSAKHAMAFGFGAPPPAFQPVVLVAILYNGPESEGRKFFEPLLALGPLVTMVDTIPYSSVNGMLNPLTSHGGRKSMKGGVFLFPLEPAFVQGIFDDFCAFLRKVPEAVATLIMFEYLKADKITKVAPTAMAFANRGQHCTLMVGPMWVNKENDAVCRQWARDVTAKFRAELERKRSLGVDETTKISVGEYPNYDGIPPAPSICNAG
jgi:hypothetical protein